MVLLPPPPNHCIITIENAYPAGLIAELSLYRRPVFPTTPSVLSAREVPVAHRHGDGLPLCSSPCTIRSRHVQGLGTPLQSLFLRNAALLCPLSHFVTDCSHAHGRHGGYQGSPIFLHTSVLSSLSYITSCRRPLEESWFDCFSLDLRYSLGYMSIAGYFLSHFLHLASINPSSVGKKGLVLLLSISNHLLERYKLPAGNGTRKGQPKNIVSKQSRLRHGSPELHTKW